MMRAMAWPPPLETAPRSSCRAPRCCRAGRPPNDSSPETRKGARVAPRALETRRNEAKLTSSSRPWQRQRRPKRWQRRQQPNPKPSWRRPWRRPWQRQRHPWQRPWRRQRHPKRRQRRPKQHPWRQQRFPHPSSRPRDRERRRRQQQRERSCACMVSLNSEWTKHGTRPGRKPTAIVDFARQLTSLARGCKHLVVFPRYAGAVQGVEPSPGLCRGCDRDGRAPA